MLDVALMCECELLSSVPFLDPEGWMLLLLIFLKFYFSFWILDLLIIIIL